MPSPPDIVPMPRWSTPVACIKLILAILILSFVPACIAILGALPAFDITVFTVSRHRECVVILITSRGVGCGFTKAPHEQEKCLTDSFQTGSDMSSHFWILPGSTVLLSRTVQQVGGVESRSPSDAALVHQCRHARGLGR